MNILSKLVDEMDKKGLKKIPIPSSNLYFFRNEARDLCLGIEVQINRFKTIKANATQKELATGPCKGLRGFDFIREAEKFLLKKDAHVS